MNAEDQDEATRYGEDEAMEDSEDTWECAFPGRCLVPHGHHQHWECYTLADAEAIATAELDPFGD